MTDLNPEGLEKAADAAETAWLNEDGDVWREIARAAVEELDALPWWSLVQGHDGFKHLRHPDGWMLAVFGNTKPHLAREIELPATVIYRP